MERKQENMKRYVDEFFKCLTHYYAFIKDYLSKNKKTRFGIYAVLCLCVIFYIAYLIYMYKDRYELEDGTVYVGEWDEKLECPNGVGYIVVYNEDADNDTIRGLWDEGNLVEIYHKSQGYSDFDGLMEVASYSDVEHCFQARTYPSGERYLGFFKDGERNGDLGLAIKPDGTMQFGGWENGVCKSNPSFAIEEHVYGVDVSHYQSLNWDEFCFRCNSSGYVSGEELARPYDVLPVLFAMAKATEGSDMVDSKFKGWYHEASRHRIIRGAYHVLTLLSSVDDQVDNYLKTVGTFQTADLPPILDVEDRPGHNERNNSILVARALNWLKKVEEKTGKCPILYIGENLYRKYILNSGKASEFRKYPLWIANYNKKPSNNINYVFWQFTKSGFVNGSKEKMDINQFNGNYRQLEQFVKKYGFMEKWTYHK